jgi:cystathionine beta-lyase/cystathionine gamma-synthase
MNIHPKVTPIYQTSVFKFNSLAELEEYYTVPGRGGRYGYSRSEHPNSDELVAEVAKLEGAEGGGVATGAGLAGLLAAVLATCRAVRGLSSTAFGRAVALRHRDNLRAAC